MQESRVLLEGDTLRIGFHGVGKAPYPEDIAAAAVLRATAQHLTIDLETKGVFWGDYCYFAGVTGEAFRILDFLKLGEASQGKPLVERYGSMTAAEMYQHGLEAAGLEFKWFAKPWDKEELRRRIVESLQEQKTPAIGIGVFGPPEPFLITGFDEGGDVLLGWSHFQGDAKGNTNISFDAGGQFRLRNWSDAVDGVIIVGPNKGKAALRDTYAAALERGVRELRVRGGKQALGTAAIEKWATHLEREQDFAGFSEPQWKQAHQDHSVMAGDLAERRALAGSFVELAQRYFPEAAEDLAVAQAAFWGAHDTVYEIWETVAGKGPFDPDIAKFKDQARRHTMAGLVRRLAALDRRAAAALERALKVIGGKDAGPSLAEDVLDGTVLLKKVEVSRAGKPIWAPENIAIANSASMLKEFLGTSFGNLNDAERARPKLDYSLCMGFTGAAFGTANDGPERANLPLLFDALGYDYELWLSGKLAKETGLPCRVWGWDDNLRRRIYWNLRDRKLPVLLFDCGAWPNWYMITGCERCFGFRGYGGNSGEGYRPNEPLDHPKNPLRKIDMMAGMKGRQTWTINVLGQRPGPKPAMEELYRQAVVWGARTMAQPQLMLLAADEKPFVSTRPYHDWAQMMKTDALFPAGDAETLKRRRDWLAGYEVELAERRHYGAEFLELAAVRLGRPELKEAAVHFHATNKALERIWTLLGGMEAPQGHLKYAQRTTREAIAAILLDIDRQEQAAAALLATAAR